MSNRLRFVVFWGILKIVLLFCHILSLNSFQIIGVIVIFCSTLALIGGILEITGFIDSQRGPHSVTSYAGFWCWIIVSSNTT